MEMIVSKCFNTNAVQRYKYFKCFFTLADPRKPNLPKAAHSNYKVDEFSSHLNKVSLEAYNPGKI